MIYNNSEILNPASEGVTVTELWELPEGEMNCNMSVVPEVVLLLHFSFHKMRLWIMSMIMRTQFYFIF